MWKREPEITPPHPHNRLRRIVDTNSIKARLDGLGWKIKEIPVRKCSHDSKERTVLHYKVIVIKGETSMEVTGSSLDEAISTIGMQLGVIPRN